MSEFSEFRPKEALNKITQLPERPDFSVPPEEAYRDFSVMDDSELKYKPAPDEFSRRLNNETETLAPDAKYLDFFNLNDAEKLRLGEHIKKCGGKIRIFVHPFYNVSRSSTKEQIEDQFRTDQIMQKILKLDEEHRPPVLFMESFIEIMQLYKMIKEFNADSIYIAPTFPETAQPYPSDDSLYYQNKIKSEVNWKPLMNLLRELDVSTILIGGFSLSLLHSSLIYSANPGKYDKLSSCLGNAINHFRDAGFKVQLSNASSVTRAEFHDRTSIKDI